MVQFIDSKRLMASWLSNLVNNPPEGVHIIKCKYGQDFKKCETCRITYDVYDCFLEYTNFKDNLIEFKCLSCNKNHQHKFNEKLKEWFFNTFNFSNHDNNKLILCCEKVSTLMNASMIWKSSIKYHYLKKKIFIVT